MRKFGGEKEVVSRKDQVPNSNPIIYIYRVIDLIAVWGIEKQELSMAQS